MLTFHGQATDKLPTVGRQTANCRPTVGWQTADCRPTGFLGSSSSQLPMIQWHNNSRKEKYLISPFIKSFSIHCIFHNSHFPHFSFSYYLHTFKYYSSIQALYLYIFLYLFLLDIFTLCIFYTLIFHTLHSLHSTLWVFYQTKHVATKSVFIMKFYLKNIPENGFKMV